MPRTGFHSLPPEVQHQIFFEFSTDDVLHFLWAHQLSPESLNGVFQLITNHNDPSALFENTITPVHLDDYDASVHRALINVIELTDFFNVDQKMLYRKIPCNPTFFYVVRKKDPEEDLLTYPDEDYDVDDISDDEYDGGNEGLDSDDMDYYRRRARRLNRLTTFFQRFLKFSKMAFYDYELSIDMSRCPYLADVTIVRADAVVLEKASSGLPKLMEVRLLDLKDPTKALFEECRRELTEGGLSDLIVGNDSLTGPGFEMELQQLNVQSNVILYHFHTLKTLSISCHWLDIKLHDRPTGDPPLLKDLFLIAVENVSISFSSQPPIVSDVFLASTHNLRIYEPGDGCSQDQVTTFLESIMSKAPKLKQLFLGKKFTNAILSSHQIISTSLNSLFISFDPAQLHNIWTTDQTYGASFPNITSLCVEFYVDSSTKPHLLDHFPNIVALRLETLTLDFANASFLCSRIRSTGSLINHHANIKHLIVANGSSGFMTSGVDTPSFRQILSPICSKLVSLKMTSVTSEFMKGNNLVFSELRKLEIYEPYRKLPLDSVQTDPWELNIEADKLETLVCHVHVDAQLMIRNFPALKTIEFKCKVALLTLDGLPELQTINLKAQLFKVITGTNLPKLKVVIIPQGLTRDNEEVLNHVFNFDETVNPSFKLVSDQTHVFL